jgi:hypothetical protein
LFTAMIGIFTPAYSVSKRTGSDGVVDCRQKAAMVGGERLSLRPSCQSSQAVAARASDRWVTRTTPSSAARIDAAHRGSRMDEAGSHRTDMALEGLTRNPLSARMIMPRLG